MRWGILIVGLLLSACAPRPGPALLSEVPIPPPAGAKLVTVYVATTRARANSPSIVFLDRRSDNVNFSEFTISIPPTHRRGNIEWPRGEAADPASTFATVKQRMLSRAEFEMRTAPRPDLRGAGVFVHGFNVNFQEALFQLAQLSADADVSGVPVLFAWPSAAKVTSYLADKDAVTASRDGLAEVLTTLTRHRKEREMLVVAHSMGAWLAVETLRQLRLTRRESVLDRLDVILAAPDIDIDVFRSQLATIGRLKLPMKVLVAHDDAALGLSSGLAGHRPRLGTVDVRDPRVAEAAQRYNVQVVDISSVSSTDRFNHSRFAQLITMQGRIAAQSSASGGIQRAGAFVFDPIAAAIASPVSLLGR